jgi:hypothetical protein
MPGDEPAHTWNDKTQPFANIRRIAEFINLLDTGAEDGKNELSIEVAKRCIMLLTKEIRHLSRH